MPTQNNNKRHSEEFADAVLDETARLAKDLDAMVERLASERASADAVVVQQQVAAQQARNEEVQNQQDDNDVASAAQVIVAEEEEAAAAQPVDRHEWLKAGKFLAKSRGEALAKEGLVEAVDHAAAAGGAAEAATKLTGWKAPRPEPKDRK